MEQIEAYFQFLGFISLAGWALYCIIELYKIWIADWREKQQWKE
jgi:hypothetical protein